MPLNKEIKPNNIWLICHKTRPDQTMLLARLDVDDDGLYINTYKIDIIFYLSLKWIWSVCLQNQHSKS